METIIRRITLPLKYLLLALSYLVPRNKSIWCFGSSFGGNAKYLFIYMSENMGDRYHCVWIGSSATVSHLRNLGFEAYTQWSLKGIYYSLRGGVYVYNSYPSNVNLYTMGGAKLVNLWHGVALKCIDRQIKEGPTAKYYQAKGLLNNIRYLNFRKHADVVLSTSPLMTENFSEAFDVTEKDIVEGIYPRCVLFSQNRNDVYSFIDKYEGELTKSLVDRLSNFGYIYFYLPTWRDTGDDFITQCGFDFAQLNEVMKKHDRLFIFKMHPDSKLKLDVEYSNIIIIDKNVDIYPVLPFTDCLITDFSSIYFDYLLMDEKQIILFVPDYDDYINKSRSLKYPYNGVMKGKKIRDFSSLVQFLDEDVPFFRVTDVEIVRKKFWNPQYKNIEQLVEGIDNKIRRL